MKTTTLLLIADNAESAASLVKWARNRSNRTDFHRLALWPTAAAAFHDSGVAWSTSDDRISGGDHDEIAAVAATLASNWWRSVANVEPQIDGLSFSEIFRYDVEMALAAILIQSLAASRTIDDLAPVSVALVRNTSLAGEGAEGGWKGGVIPTIWSRGPLEKLLEAYCAEAGIEFVKIDGWPMAGHRANPSHRRLTRTGARLRRGFWKLFQGRTDYVTHWWQQRRMDRQGGLAAFFAGLKPHTIVIEGNPRCLGALIETASRYRPVAFLPTAGLEVERSNQNLEPDAAGTMIRDIRIDGMDLGPIVGLIAATTMQLYPKLKAHYQYLREILRTRDVFVYVTVRRGDSLSRLTFWAFHRAGVRSIWLPDGLGQPWPSIWPAINSGYWPTAPGEE